MADAGIQGLSELLKAMRELPRTVERKVLRSGVLAGATIIRKSAQEFAVRRSGLMARAIRVAFNRTESIQGRAVYHVFVSARVRGGKKNWPPFYWRYVEFGTVKMAAKPFMRPGFDVSSGQAASAITNKLADGVEKEAQKLGKG